jgi:PPOX class probable F420-dependent enzyme
MAKLNDDVRAYLAEPRFAVMATIMPDGLPQQTVMWYELQGDEIVMNTRRGRIKDLNLVRDPRLSFCVPDGYRYVTLTGTATLIEDQAVAQADIRRLAIRYHGPEKGAEQARRLFSQQERITIRLHIDRVVADLDE